MQLPKLVLNVLFAISELKPIAVKTWDGSLSPVEQAEPADAQIPTSSNCNNKFCASTPLNDIFAFPGKRFTLSPFNLTSGIVFKIVSM